MRWLGVDMGGTATRWVTRDATGRIVAQGSGPGATALGLVDPALKPAFDAALRAVTGQAGGPLAGAVLGLTGSGLHPGKETVAAVARLLPLPATRVSVLNDMVLAWHAVYPSGPGHLIAAGTGSVGLSIDEGGKATLVGGRGSLIDDAGSGAWIGLRALDALWRIIDEQGHPAGAQVLADHLFRAVGGADWEATRRFVYGADRGAIGTLARAVAEAATDGDALALGLMTRAGQELARLAQALDRRCGPAPLAAIGGVLTLHPAIARALEAALPGTEITYPTVDAAAHAALIACDRYPETS